MNSDHVLEVSEWFGPTFQGEGPNTGRRCWFVRLARCDLACTWCDSAYTWRWDGLYAVEEGRPTYNPAEQIHPMTVRQVLDAINPTGLVVVTGGEPMLQRRGLYALAAGVRDRGGRVNVETNGRHAPAAELADEVDLFVVSPKLTSSGEPRSKAWRDGPIEAFRELAGEGRAVFKFVVADDADLADVEAFQAYYRVDPATVWVMPEGRDDAKLAAGARWLAEVALDRGWNLTGRMHVALWGDERGR